MMTTYIAQVIGMIWYEIRCLFLFLFFFFFFCLFGYSFHLLDGSGCDAFEALRLIMF